MENRNWRILFIEDEPNLLNSMTFILEREGFTVRKADSGEKGLSAIPTFSPDLLLLDLNLPGMDGFEVAEEIKTRIPDHCPAIIILTGREDERDVVAGLERFADDYIIKPVQPRVLIARIHSVLRRLRETLPQPPSFTVPQPIHINRDSFVVTVEGKPIRLTKSEFSILDLLMRSPEKVLSRGQIINAVKGLNCYVTERVIDFQICRIRKKLGKYGGRIATVRGVGYKFTVNTDFSC